MLEYSSLAADNGTRQIWPVEVGWLARNFSTLTNAWRKVSWGWGNNPHNARPALFLTVVELNQTYSINYRGKPPTNSLYRLQKRDYPNGVAGDWVVLTLNFSGPQCIEVYSCNSQSSESLISSVFDPSIFSVNPTCGQNSIDFYSGVVKFVVSGFNNCSVRVEVANYLLLTLYLDVALSDFNSKNGSENLEVTLAQHLNLSQSRVKVRRLRSGSTIADLTVSASSSSTNPRNDLNIINDRITQEITQGILTFTAPLLSFNSTISIVGEPAIPIKIADIQPAVKGLIGVSLVIGMILFISIFVYRRLRIKKATVHPEEEEHIQRESEGVGEKSSELNIGDDLKFND